MKLIKKGDWVSFMRNSRIVIAEVKYIKETVLHDPIIYTDQGEITEESVLEVRPEKED